VTDKRSGRQVHQTIQRLPAMNPELQALHSRFEPYLIHPWPDVIWADYWLVTGVCLPLLISIGTTIWFTIGCWKDIILFFRRLRVECVDNHDDGTVDRS